MKECSKCKQLLELFKFSIIKGKHLAACKSCVYCHYVRPSVIKRLEKKGKKPKEKLTPEESKRRQLIRFSNYRKSSKGKEAAKRYAVKNREIINKKNKEAKALKSLNKPKRIKLTDEQKKQNRRNWYLANRKLKPKEIKVNLNKPLVKAIRRRFEKALKGNKKQGKTVELLGCTIPEFKVYLESLFLEGMTWDNRSEWHIDHIKPLCSFDLSKHEEQAKACHYTNLRPLWAKDNLIKSKEDVKMKFSSDIQIKNL